VILGSVVGVALALSVVHSRVFHLRTIRVSGESHLTRSEVVGLSGLTPATNVLWLNAGRVVERLESDPWIARATVEKTLPSGVRIDIVERVPVAVAQQGSALVLVAADGTTLGPAREGPGLPLIAAGGPASGTGALGFLSDAARAIASLDRDLRSRVREVMPAPDGTVEMLLTSGTRVLYGPPTDMARKAGTLRALLRWAEAQASPVAQLDVRSPDAPTALLGSPGASSPPVPASVTGSSNPGERRLDGPGV